MQKDGEMLSARLWQVNADAALVPPDGKSLRSGKKETTAKVRNEDLPAVDRGHGLGDLCSHAN